MPDYNTLAATARRLVNSSGRDVKLIELDYSATDPTKPWRGPANPRETPAHEITLKAVFVVISGDVKLGASKMTMDLAKKASAFCFIGSTLDLSIYHELIDSKDQRRYKISHQEVLAPGDTTLLTYLVLNQ